MSYKIDPNSPYYKKIGQLVPGEFIGAYLAIQTLMQDPNQDQGTQFWVYLAAMVVLAAILPFYLWRIFRISNALQIAVTTVSFVVWVYALGGPFTRFGLWSPKIGGALLVVWTFIPPILGFSETRPQKSANGEPANAQP